jgi:hypothetical protein
MFSYYEPDVEITKKQGKICKIKFIWIEGEMKNEFCNKLSTPLQTKYSDNTDNTTLIYAQLTSSGKHIKSLDML